jgi:beta-1,4-mannosyltransferase
MSFSRSATRRIYLTRSSLTESGDVRGVFVPHGDYLPVVAREAASIRNSEPGRIVVFGRMRPYKGVEELIDAFASIRRRGLSLTVAGKPIDSQFADRLAALAEHDQRITLRLGSLSESDLVNAVTTATVAVFPYREIFNSGAVLYALSFARPVIATRSPSMAELQDEVGPEWVQLIESPVSQEGLDAAINQLAVLAGKRTGHSPLRGRGWTEIAQTHAMLYREVADPGDRRTADRGDSA